MSSDRVRAAAALLLERAGLGGSFRVEPVAGGANSRAHRIDRNGQAFFLKEYFRHPRTRGTASGRLLVLPVRLGPPDQAGAPPVCDGRGQRVRALRVHRRDRVRPGQVCREHVRQALDFYSEINRHRGDPEALALGPASEAFFARQTTWSASRAASRR